MAANQVASGFSDCILAGGVESISTTQGQTNMHMYVNEKLAEDVPGIYHAMGQTAECVAKRYNITREAQDEYALSSQQRTAAAQEGGFYDDEIIPMDTVMKLVNKETGEELWKYKLPAGGYATPITYKKDGKQYVVIACGGGKMGTPSGNKYVAFHLNK